ncbi:MAG: alpha/beta fold hydrolase [Phycisphaerae bacterium]
MNVRAHLCAAVCVLVAWAGGCTRDEVPGRVVEVDAGGHRLHLVIVGEAGPTVVLESGLGGGVGWERVRARVGRFARAVTYDRAGFGKSESGPQPRDARQIATELHTALGHAGLLPPYVLVGHSMGGVYVRVFAGMYPLEVSGMVLVDPTQVNACASMEEIHRWFEAHCAQDWPTVAAACDRRPEAVRCLGWMQALEAKRMEAFLQTLQPPQRERMRRAWLAHVTAGSAVRPGGQMNRSVHEEFQAATESFREAIAARPLTGVPIVLLAAAGQESLGATMEALNPEMRLLQAEVQRWHVADYREWAAATPGAKLVVAPGCGHNIQEDDPDLVAGEIREVISGSNGRRP